MRLAGSVTKQIHVQSLELHYKHSICNNCRELTLESRRSLATFWLPFADGDCGFGTQM